MSRIGRMPLRIPEGVRCEIGDKTISIVGPKGSFTVPMAKGFLFSIIENNLKIDLLEDVKPLPKDLSSMYGTVCRTMNNFFQGVSMGFKKKLELVGVGYKADLQGRVLKLSLGYSHDIFYSIPEGITISMEKPTLFEISGADKQKVGQSASEIIRFRPPEPYKGKGVRVPGQFLRMKEGKSK